MIDMVEVGTLSASDFVFKAGDSSTPSSWSTVNGSNVSISVREDAGKDGSDRVTILFNNAEVKDEWLQVTVLANANTGLDAADVFYAIMLHVRICAGAARQRAVLPRPAFWQHRTRLFAEFARMN